MTEPKKEPGAVAAADRADIHKQDSVIVPPSRHQEKTFARLAALAALKGIELHRLHDGTFLVGRWGMSRHFQTLDDAAKFLRQMGVGDDI